MTTKILAMVDALGNLIDFKLMPGQRNDICGVAPLIEGKEFAALLADKAFDADWLLLELEERGSVAVIPPRRNRKEQRAYDKEAYKKRHEPPHNYRRADGLDQAALSNPSFWR